MPQLGDLQLLISNECPVGSGPRTAGRHFRLQRIEIIRQGFRIGIHARSES
jgi:hypothetical protein